MKHALISFLMAFSFTACGESPILNHANEKAQGMIQEVSSAAAEYAFAKAGLSFTVDWIVPAHVGLSAFKLKIWKTGAGTVNGPYVEPKQNLHVFLWMPTMGHGSAPVKMVKTAAGEYTVNDVAFIMAGKWQVKFQLLAGGKVADETVLSISL